jgi:DEAD/DEAH box helicase domain-containing protein
VQWYREGKMNEILKYCEQDVRVTKEIFDFGHRHGHVIYENPNSHQMLKLEVDW